MKKKILSLLLTLVILLGMLPVGAVALEDNSDDFVIEDGNLIKYNGSDEVVVIPDGVTRIKFNAFQGCTNLSSVVIPDGVTCIEDGAFSLCTNLSSVTIPNTVTTIKSYAFNSCANLDSITIPDSVVSIEGGVFGDCTSLTSVTIPSSVTSIGSDAFLGCTNLVNITLSEGITSIGQSAFFGCSSLPSVTLPAGITSIGRGMFTNCTNLTTVVIPDSVTSIGGSAFSNCPNLTSITIPDGVTSIERNTFSGCKSLTSITIPSSVTSIGELAFHGCAGLTNVTIPDSVTSIGKEAFRYCGNLTQVRLPAGLNVLEDNAFGGCSKLSQVSIPANIQTLNYAAFAATPWLEAQTDSDGFIIQGHTLIQYIGSGGDVVIPNGVTEIKENAFTNHTAWITSLTVPAGVTTGMDLSGFQRLKKLVLNGPTTITNFWYCKNLTEIIPIDNLANLHSANWIMETPWGEDKYDKNGFAIIDGVLLGYRGPGGNVVIPNTVTVIADLAFSNNNSITALTIPDSVTQLGSYMCNGCKNLATLKLGRGITEIPPCAFTNLTSLEKITIPNTVVKIDGGAFSGCDALKSVTFEEPVSVNRLGTDTGDSVHITGIPTQNLPSKFWAAFYQNEQELWFNPGQFMEPQSERITELSNQITAGCKTDYEKVKAIHDWVHKNIAYDHDYYDYHKKPLFEVTLEPEEVLDSRLTICDGYARLVRALLLAQEIPVYYVTGWASNDAHAWNEVYADGRWFLLDATWGKKYFDMPVYEFATSHTMGVRKWEDEMNDITREANTPSQWAQSEVWDAIWTNKLIPYDLQADYRANITREDFCRIMITLVEKKTGKTAEEYIASRGLTLTDPFTDTDNEAVLAAHALGIVNGTSATTFEPDGSIIRQEAAAMLSRTARVLGMTTGESMQFSDTAALDGWAKESIAFVSGLTDPTSGNRVMGGTGEGHFSPFDTYTREQAILTTLRLFHATD